jgi:hypothetical protein
MTRRLIAAALITLLAGSAGTSQSKSSPSHHTISFTFDYDFRTTPACSATVKKNCVQKFNFYDISLGILKKVPLGSIPVPAGATGPVKGITFTTERRLFSSGKHMLAVAAQRENGFESDLRKCTTTVDVH